MAIRNVKATRHSSNVKSSTGTTLDRHKSTEVGPRATSQHTSDTFLWKEYFNAELGLTLAITLFFPIQPGAIREQTELREINYSTYLR